ncbi:L-type lectin-domain-containing protein [Cinnamomum micranthum f. kanehirae]|uniref:L-type lectin-domain-containing protein n=1 Tax=Cinnamomum micranthum f. kanehirae TaxID=337451 RepID=A0A443NDV7_9MAGN|nr:L-type lectin-domain-containing protein [Cinnamomum micranthum f. kanehirae]
MPCASGDEVADFAYTGFHGSNVSLNGIAAITPDGLLVLTDTSKQKIGRAFYPAPLRFKNSSNGNAISFSTTFIFAIVPDNPDLGGHGIAFVISPSKELHGALPSQHLGLFNASSNGNSSSHVVAVELDTIFNSEFGDINDNHVGIDINSLRSNKSSPAAYFTSNGIKNISLISGKPIQIWIEYNGEDMQLRVTLAPALRSLHIIYWDGALRPMVRPSHSISCAFLHFQREVLSEEEDQIRGVTRGLGA